MVEVVTAVRFEGVERGREKVSHRVAGSSSGQRPGIVYEYFMQLKCGNCAVASHKCRCEFCQAEPPSN